MSGDDKFNSLYRRFYKRMLHFFVRFRISEEDAQDLTHETFVRVLRGLNEYRGDAEWAYLETVARNVLYNAVRTRKTQKRGAVSTVPLDPEMAERPELATIPTVDQDIDKKRQRELIASALQAFAPRQRQCIGLWLDGYEYAEIARVLQISVDAVKSALRDAKRELREKLGAHLPEEDQ